MDSKKKDLARALRFLRDVPVVFDDSSIESSRPISASKLGFLEMERDWEVLDTCLNADDMKLVGTAYAFLKDRGFLPNFGKFRNIVLDGPRDVTPTMLKSSTGLEASKLSPKKWGVSGSSSILLIALLAGTSILLNQGIDIRPNLAAVLGLTLLDAIFLGGSCLAQISSYWPPYKRRILVHEAGHLLVAYLMGCPIRGVILDPIVAMQMGIQGQAGTQFWDEKLQNELAEGRVSGTAFDRYCMVLFAGIAAEALVYGEAEGGENDENLFRSFSVLLEPPLSVVQMSNQARWSVLQSYNLLKWQKHAHRATIKALDNGDCLVDMGMDGRTGVYSVGAVVRDSLGNLVAAKANTICSPGSVLEGELLAILTGLRMCSMFHISNVWVYSDCIEAVRLVNDDMASLGPVGSLVTAVKALLQEDGFCELRHMSRKANVVAHRLAKFALSNLQPSFWISTGFPSWINDVASFDIVD